MNKQLLLLIILVCQTYMLYSQIKYEREYRIKTDQVPDQAMEFIESFPFDGKIRWYKEENLNSISIEAKTKFKSEKYSIEFDSAGIIEDVEIEVGWEKIPATTRTAINTYLKSNFQQIKIRKIQCQYTGRMSSLKQLNTARPKHSNKSIGINYELILKVKKEKKKKLMELLFNEQGTLLKQSSIVFKNTDNLEY